MDTEFELKNSEKLPSPDERYASQMTTEKGSNRLIVEAQVKIIQKQIGNLETIRAQLGLSQRKMAQLLLVDPSAWSRWCKDQSAPPIVWRSLQWYMALYEKIPGLTPQYFLNANRSAEQNQRLEAIQVEITTLKDNNARLHKLLRQQKRKSQIFLLVNLIFFLAGMILFIQKI